MKNLKLMMKKNKIKSLKIVIINPPIRLSDKPRHIPHGLAIIANVIRKKLNLVPRFIDSNAYRYDVQQIRTILKSMDFNVVLIGGLIPVYKRIIEYSKIIKEINPNAVLIAGGSAAMSVPKLLLQNSHVDVVCAGEGESVIVELLRGLQKHDLSELTHVKGFYYKIGNKITHSENPDLLENLDEESDIPAYDLLPMDIYLSNPVVGFGRDIDFISSRGCPFNCTFCYQPWGRKFRAHSADFIIKALKYLKNNYNIDFVSFQDDEFLASKKRVYEICEKIKKNVPNLLWSCTGRANLVNDEIANKMRGSGCVSISYGFESGSKKILQSMRKNVNIKDMENAVKINRRYGMMLPVSFMIGMPEEDEESCRETTEFCIKNNIPLKSIMFATPYPGTEIFKNAVSTGCIKKDKVHDFVMSLEDARDFTINLTKAFTDEELISKREEMINIVCSRIQKMSNDVYKKRIDDLFGNLASDYLNDEALIKHRAEHGGIDIF